MVLTQQSLSPAGYRAPMNVSIPLWFSRNQKTRSSSATREWCFHTTMVLTQPVRNMKKTFGPSGFPYHYGSHATRRFIEKDGLDPKMFPYHYGSHATLPFRSVSDGISGFPYHYGSHATHTWKGSWLPSVLVSIPLWFSRNRRKSTRRHGRRHVCFHTTMVLTQLHIYTRVERSR